MESSSVFPGDSTAVTLTLVRSGGFTGAVTIALDSTHTNLAVSPALVQLSGATTTTRLSLQPGSGLAPGAYTIRLRATGDGVPTQSITLTLTVVPAPIVMTLTRSGLGAITAARGGTPASVRLLATRPLVGYVRFDVADALPTGVRVSFDPDSTLGGETVALVQADATAAPGTYTNTFRVRAPGNVADATLPLTYQVTERSTVEFQLAETTATLTPGGSTTLGFTLVRRNAATGYELVARGQPSGVTVTLEGRFEPDSSDAFTARFVADGTVTPGTWPIWYVFTARDSVLRDSAQVTLTVLPTPAGGDITLAFCGGASERPIWLGTRTGTTWTRRFPDSNDRYVFSLGANVNDLLWVTQRGADDVAITMLNATRDELRALTDRGCLDATGRSLDGTVTGTLAGDVVSVGVGARTTTFTAASASTAFTLGELAAGPLDVAAARLRAAGSPAALLADRVFLQRGASPTGASLGTIALDAAPVPDAFTVAVTGVGPGETVTVASMARTAAGTSVSLGTSTGPAASHDARALPLALRVPGDLHVVSATSVGTIGSGTVTRSVTRLIAAPTAETLSLGEMAPTATVTVTETQGGTALVEGRTQTQLDYLRVYAFTYEQQAPGRHRRVTRVRTMAALNFRDTPGRAVAFVPLNMTGASGWNSAWETSQSLPMTWTMTSFGWNAPGGLSAPVAEGVETRATTQTGTWTPAAGLRPR